MMLEQLDDIPWATLHDPDGAASNVPGYLRALTHHSSSVRNDALDRLWASLCRRPSLLGEASAYAAPFLVELCCSPGFHDRVGILNLLLTISEIARAGAVDEPTDTFEIGANGTREPPPGLTCLATFEVMSGHYSEIVALLQDADPAVRAAAAELAAELAHFDRSRNEDLVCILSFCLSREPEAPTRVSFVVGLEKLGAFELIRGTMEDPALPVRRAAARALSKLDPKAVPSLHIVHSTARTQTPRKPSPMRR